MALIGRGPNPHPYYIINEPGKGGLRLDTLAHTRRQSIVQWLTHKGYSNAVLAGFNDGAVEFAWLNETVDGDTHCVRANVDLMQGVAGNVTRGERK